MVRAQTITASGYSEQVKIRGHTENKRTVEVRAETQGRVVARPVERGTVVNAGDCCAGSRSKIVRRGSTRPKRRSTRHESNTRAACASRTAVSIQDSHRTSEVPPGLGGSATRSSRLGLRAHLQPGTVRRGRGTDPAGDRRLRAAGNTVRADRRLDPMLLVGQVSERDVTRLAIGGTATGALVSGETATGIISFIGHQADPSTRTYRVEATVPNPDHQLLSGATAISHRGRRGGRSPDQSGRARIGR